MKRLGAVVLLKLTATVARSRGVEIFAVDRVRKRDASSVLSECGYCESVCTVCSVCFVSAGRNVHTVPCNDI